MNKKDGAKTEDLAEQVKRMQLAHAREVKDLRKQVLRERLQGIEAQLELGQLLKEKALAELAALEE
jgi:hypothetical protein